MGLVAEFDIQYEHFPLVGVAAAVSRTVTGGSPTVIERAVVSERLCRTQTQLIEESVATMWPPLLE